MPGSREASEYSIPLTVRSLTLFHAADILDRAVAGAEDVPAYRQEWGDTPASRRE